MSSATLYARAIRSSLRKSAATDLPTTELTRPAAAVGERHLAAYARICGFGLSDLLPTTYPHILGFSRALELQTDQQFPFPAIGTVHVAQEVTVRRPITVTDRPALRVFASHLRPHARGQQYDMVTVASVDGEDVWTGRSTYLHRTSNSTAQSQDVADKSPDNGPNKADVGADQTGDAPEATAVWRLPADLGRRYGAVSGDRNPIHLYRATARLFGFKRQIIHGMWTFAACAAAIEDRLPDAYTIRADFKRPIFLPGKVGFSAAESDTGWEFSVRDLTRKRPHLVGQLSAL